METELSRGGARLAFDEPLRPLGCGWSKWLLAIPHYIVLFLLVDRVSPVVTLSIAFLRDPCSPRRVPPRAFSASIWGCCAGRGGSATYT